MEKPAVVLNMFEYVWQVFISKHELITQNKK